MNRSMRLLILAATLMLLIVPALSYASALEKPLLIDAGLSNAYRTDIKFDAIGNAIAVFEQKKDGVFRLYANRYISGKAWAGPEVIDSGGGNAYRGKLAVDKFGNAIVVFKQERKTGYAIFANHYVVGKGWQGAMSIDNAAGIIDGQAIAIDRNDRVAVAYEKQDGGHTGIFVSLYSGDAGWGVPSRIDSGAGNALFPQTAFDGKGNLHVVYYKEAANGFEVYAGAYDSSKSKWLDAVRIGSAPPGKTDSWKQKKSIISWDYPSEKPFISEIKANIYSGSYYYHAWSTSKVDARFRDAYTPSLVAGRNGKVTAFFINWDGSHMRAFSAGYTEDRGWGDAVLIDNGPSNVEHIRAAANSRGDMAIVFTQLNDISLRIYAKTYSEDSGWSPARIIDAGDEEAYNPSIALKEDGTIVAVWCQWVRFSEELKAKNKYMRPYDNFAVVKSFVNIYRPGKGWGIANKLEDNDNETCGVRIASAPDGNAIAIYEEEGEYPEANGFVNRIFAVSVSVTGLDKH